MNKDYRLKVTIRNDRLLTAMENMGFESMAQFTQTHGLNYERTGQIFNGVGKFKKVFFFNSFFKTCFYKPF